MAGAVFLCLFDSHVSRAGALDSELADGHCGKCQYSWMSEVMEQLDAECDQLLDEDNNLDGSVKDSDVI